MKRALVSALAILSLAVGVAGCKKSSSSSAVASLSAEEIAACKFTGQRFLLIVAPEPAFQGDLALIQDTFSKYMSGPFVDPSYIAKVVAGDPGKRGACADYYARDLSKYELFGVLGGPSSSSAALAQYIDRLAAAIKNLRTSSADPKAQAQVVIAVTSHGTNFDGRYVDGAIVLGEKDYMPFATFTQMLYEKLMTKCELTDPACENPRDRIADEIAIYMDNCYSGNLNDQLKSFISGQPGYQQPLALGTKSLATRLFAFAAASREQTAAGGLPGTNGGTVYHMMREMMGSWNADIAPADSRLSLTEMQNYMVNTSYMRFAGESRATLRNILNDTICTSKSRSSLVKAVLDNRDYFVRLAQNPEATLLTDTTMFAAKGQSLDSSPYGNMMSGGDSSLPFPMMLSIQRPSMFSNLAPDAAAQLYMAVSGNEFRKTAEGQRLLKALTDPASINLMKQEVNGLAALLGLVANSLAADAALAAKSDALSAGDLKLPDALKASYAMIQTSCGNSSSSLSSPSSSSTPSNGP